MTEQLPTRGGLAGRAERGEKTDQRVYLDDAAFADVQRVMSRARRDWKNFHAADQFYRPWLRDQFNRLKLFGRACYFSADDLMILREIDKLLDFAAGAAEARP